MCGESLRLLTGDNGSAKSHIAGRVPANATRSANARCSSLDSGPNHFRMHTAPGWQKSVDKEAVPGRLELDVCLRKIT